LEQVLDVFFRFWRFPFSFPNFFSKNFKITLFFRLWHRNKSGFVAGFDDFPVFGTFHFPFKIPFIQFQNRTFFSFGAEF